MPRCSRWLWQASPQGQYPGVHSMNVAAFMQVSGSHRETGAQVHTGTASGCNAARGRPTIKLRCRRVNVGASALSGSASDTSESSLLADMVPAFWPQQGHCSRGAERRRCKAQIRIAWLKPFSKTSDHWRVGPLLAAPQGRGASFETPTAAQVTMQPMMKAISRHIDDHVMRCKL